MAFTKQQWRSISKWKQKSFPGATTEMLLSSSWPKIKSGPEHLRWTRRINIPNDPRSVDLFLASGIFGMLWCFTDLHEQFIYKCLLSTKWNWLQFASWEKQIAIILETHMRTISEHIHVKWLVMILLAQFSKDLQSLVSVISYLVENIFMWQICCHLYTSGDQSVTFIHRWMNVIPNLKSSQRSASS